MSAISFCFICLGFAGPMQGSVIHLPIKTFTFNTPWQLGYFWHLRQWWTALVAVHQPLHNMRTKKKSSL